MDLRFENVDNSLFVYCPSRIDTQNAAEFETAIFKLFEEQKPKTIVLNLQDLEYISSVGLRIVLKIKKQYNDVSLVEVSSEVYEIFSMTGFTDIIDIKKALRVVSIEGCKIIGEGFYGKVYRISPDTILKHYFKGNPVDDIERERQNAKNAFVLGVPTAISYDVVRVKEGGYGAVYELIDAKSLKNYLLDLGDSIDEAIKISANLLKILNRTECISTNLPRALDVAASWIKNISPFFSDDENARIKDLIDTIPDDDYLIHGDCHVKNVFIQEDEPILIDMDSMQIGANIFEYADLYIPYVAYALDDPTNQEKFFGISAKICSDLFYGILHNVYGGRNDYEEVVEKILFLGDIHFLSKIQITKQNFEERQNNAIKRIKERLNKLSTLKY
ncbi:MAG: anti-sigma factor antagonist [Bacilli bacterium]|nr:anti-sigma factor antagonist [Bacilli bacterium]